MTTARPVTCFGQKQTHPRDSNERRVHRFYRVAIRKRIYGSIAALQDDLDEWIRSYNEDRPHQGRWCFGKTPMQTFLDAIPLAQEKMIAA